MLASLIVQCSAAALAALAAAQSAPQAPPWERFPALAQWKQEMESGGAQILAVTVDGAPGAPIQWDPLAPGAALAAPFLAEPAFAQQIVRAHALTINFREAAGSRHLIFLNRRYAAQWEPFTEALLAHELGHIWLDQRGYTGLAFQPGPAACVSVHATDLVQHAILERETRRRGIDLSRYALSKVSVGKPLRFDQAGGCSRLAAAVQILDARAAARSGDDPRDIWDVQYPGWGIHLDSLIAIRERPGLEAADGYKKALADAAGAMSTLAVSSVTLSN